MRTLTKALFIFLLAFAANVKAQTTYTWANGTGAAANWGVPTNWTPNGIPGTNDSVVLTINSSSQTIITVDTNRTVRAISFTSTNKDVTLNLSSGITLTVTRNITFNTVSANGTQLFNIGAGAIICDSIIMVTQGNANRVNSMTMSSGSLTCRNITMAACASCDAANIISMTGAGTFNVSGSIVNGTGPAGNDGTIDLGTLGTQGFTGTTGTQTVPAGSYANMKITGGGTKRLGGAVTINAGGRLKWSGNSTLDTNGFSLSYNTSAWLVYEDAANGYTYTTGNEWPTNNGPRRVQVNLTGTTNPTVTLASSRTITDTLMMTAGSLGIGANTLTLNGIITGTGTLSGNGTSSNLTVGGSGAFGTIYMNQTKSDTTNRLNNLTLGRTSGTYTLGNTMQVIGIASVSAGTLTTGGNLVMAAASTTSYGRIDYNAAGTISGNVTCQKYLSNIAEGWRHFSFPVTMNLSSGVTGLMYLTTSHGIASQRSIMKFDPVANSGRIANGWSVATNSDNQNNAYAIYNNNYHTGLHEISNTISASGALITSDYTVNLYNNWEPTGSTGGSIEWGWNFIPNKFQSNLDVGNFIRDAAFGTGYKAVHVWDFASQQYKGINQSTLINYNTVGGTLDTATNLAPWQGFWVKADSVNQSITVKKSLLTTSMTSVVIFHKTSPNFFRLNVFDADNKLDQVAVEFNENATDGFDGIFDLYKIKSNNADVPTLYFAADKTNYSAMVVPHKKKRDFDLSFESHKDDRVYRFHAMLDYFTAVGSVILEDKKTGTFTDLRTDDYVFIHDASYKTDRFVVHYEEDVTSVNFGKTSKVAVYAGAEGINIVNNDAERTIKVNIYNTLGQLVYTNENISASEKVQFTPVQNNATQVYLVKVNSASGIETFKVIF